MMQLINLKSFIHWENRVGLVVVGLMLVACASTDTALNSDRIERAFGNYGVEILRADETRRVTSLHSSDSTGKTTRTYAVVQYRGTPHALIAAEHAKILKGGSIGATFRAAGWEIDKQHVFIGELEVPKTYTEIASLMRVSLPESLAAHSYLFNVRRDERTLQYATITEIHHPDYLDAATLESIYGEIIYDDSNRDGVHDFIGPPKQ